MEWEHYFKIMQMNDDPVIYEPEIIESDDDDKSSFFYGRWMLFEVEIRVCTVPFLQWADGNMEP